MKITRAVSAIIAVVAALSLGTAAQAISLDFVTVGDPGNANDTSTGYGKVDYTYAMGKYEVTLLQYTAFLNAVAQTDTYNLYNASMATDPNIAGISRANGSGSYAYSVLGDGQRPVTYVSWFDAARFTNWLHNGQPTGIGEVAGSTEQGAYTLNGATSGIITKNLSAQYWIPSENEWYKAAHYDPVNPGADANGTEDYWLYPTQSDTEPGNVVGGSANQANYYNGVYSVTQSASYSSSENYLTDVGAFTNSASHYGTFDQGGNVFEWNDAVTGSSRGLRGGAWSNSSPFLQSSTRFDFDPSFENFNVGFRVATVPEPNTVVSIMVGLGMLVWWRKRPFSL